MELLCRHLDPAAFDVRVVSVRCQPPKHIPLTTAASAMALQRQPLAGKTLREDAPHRNARIESFRRCWGIGSPSASLHDEHAIFNAFVGHFACPFRRRRTAARRSRNRRVLLPPSFPEIPSPCSLWRRAGRSDAFCLYLVAPAGRAIWAHGDPRALPRFPTQQTPVSAVASA